jgi:F420-dependent oxidoreductase-like protein
MRIGLQIPLFTTPGGPATLGADLATVARTADEVGFEYLAVMDHFFQIGGVGPPELEMLEAYTTLGFLAAHTSRIQLLSVMTGVIYRYPGILAKTVTTLDVLSGGRAWLGIGAAWNEEESRGLGVPFPPVAERFERLEEALQICQQMWRGDESPYHGRHYRLERPLNSPQPLRKPHPPIMIGGGGERKTLRMVAQYADACNLFATPDVEHKLEVLRQHCARLGRPYEEILKTVYYPFTVGPDGERVEQTLDDLRRLSGLGFQAAIGAVADVWRIAPLEVIGREIIPAVASW